MQTNQNEEYEEIYLHGAEGANALYQALTEANERTYALGLLYKQQNGGLDPEAEKELSAFLEMHPDMKKAQG